MSFLEIAGWGLGILFAIYLIPRLISAAFFRSKQDYDSQTKRKHHD